jgi:deoxyribodipyrimidine photolyase-related protein
MVFFLIFPIHLFRNIDLLQDKKVFIVEDPRFFTDFHFHKMKIAFHRATMKSYFDYLKKKKIQVDYIECDQVEKMYDQIKINNIECYDPNDHKLEKKIRSKCKKLEIIKTLNFTFHKKIILENLSQFKTKNGYNHQNFYKWQRVRLNILVDKNGNPKGGKWSFDEENRQKLPSSVSIPQTHLFGKNQYVKEAIHYVTVHFSKNPGNIEPAYFVYPVTFEECDQWLTHFLKIKFKLFGKYQDAETMRDPFLFHSVLSPLLNVGLFTDTELLSIVSQYESKVPIASYEGFIRQVIGWRNYCYMIYLLEGEKMRKMNFFKHNHKINYQKMWNGTTNILPIDEIIKKIINTSYAHHIERLMYLGNFMLLCMIHPTHVYTLFMEWTIDAYDWVMVPNVYGMSQFADGGMMMTRCYFSSSNYVLKMSDFKKNKEWEKIWDALYYHFIYKHEDYLASNYATSRQVAFWKKKSETEKNKIIQDAKKYLEFIINK